MRRTRCTAMAAVVSLLLAACGSSSHFDTRSAANGRILTNDKGMTLYTYDRDGPGRSACNALCAEQFPPYRASLSGRPQGKWTIVARDDRGRQWAYEGRPVYVHAEDKRPGDTLGQGADEDRWHVAKP